MRMARAGIPVVLIVAVLAPLLSVEAQPSGRAVRVGWIGTSRAGPFEAFRQGLRERGWGES